MSREGASSKMMGKENHEITEVKGALQDEDGGEQMEAYMFQNQFFPEGEFHVVSEQLDVPNPAGVGEGGLLSDFNTRIIQYTNRKNTFAYFFPYKDAEVKQGVLYRLGIDEEDIGGEDGGEGGETPRANLVNVTFQQVAPEEEF